MNFHLPLSKKSAKKGHNSLPTTNMTHKFPKAAIMIALMMVTIYKGTWGQFCTGGTSDNNGFCIDSDDETQTSLCITYDFAIESDANGNCPQTVVRETLW
jgi:hypothetical protein